MPLDSTELDLKEMQTLGTDLKKATDEVKTFAERVQTEMKNLGAATSETKANADKALTEMGQISTRLNDVEQKMARRTGTPEDREQLKTLGEHVVANEEVKNRLLGGNKKGAVSFSVETKTILSATGTWGSTASVGNSLVAPDRQIGMLPLPMRSMTVRDLFAPGQTTSNQIEYAIQTTRTNNAAVVAEAALKPSSTYAWDLRSYPVRTIAHLVKASRQILDDAPALQSIIDAEMRYGLGFAEETELLTGDGTGQHILGLIPQATAYSQQFSVTDETSIDRLRQAMLQAALALFPVSGTVLHPTDWTHIEMQKDSLGRYIIGDPQGTVAPRLWGVPVVTSLAMTVGSYVTGSFKQCAQIFDRMAVEVLISTENNDDWEKNMVTIRAEERLAFVAKRPTAFITGTLP